MRYVVPYPFPLRGQGASSRRLSPRFAGALRDDNLLPLRGILGESSRRLCLYQGAQTALAAVSYLKCSVFIARSSHRVHDPSGTATAAAVARRQARHCVPSQQRGCPDTALPHQQHARPGSGSLAHHCRTSRRWRGCSRWLTPAS